MKLLMTADTVGGVWTYALELCRVLAPRGVEVVLATRGAPLSAAQRSEVAALENLEVVESRLKLEWMEEPWEDVQRASGWLLELDARHRPHVIHLNDYAHGALPFQAPVVLVGHSCVLSWYRAVRGHEAPPSWDRYRQEVTRGVRGADVVVAPSRAMLESLAADYGPILSGRVIHNGRSPELFRPAAKEPFIFAAGRLWDEAKNLGALDEIAARLPWPVYAAGEATSPDGAAAAHRSINLLGRLPPDRLAGWLSRASIYALPAKYEPFGLSVLEAALSGCALVLGDIPSLRELWEGAATFVDPDDQDALRERLVELVCDPARRRELAEAAQERAEDYTPEMMASRYLTVYRELLARPDLAASASGEMPCTS